MQKTISLNQIIKDTSAVCTTHYKQLLKYTSVLASLGLIFTLFANKIEENGEPNNISFWPLLVMAVLSPFAIYFALRLFIAVSLIAYDALNHKYDSSKDYFTASKAPFWYVLGVSLLSAVAYLAPLFIGLILASITFITRESIWATSGGIVAAFSILFYIRLMFSTYSSIFSVKSATAHLRYSIKITKGKFFFVLGLLILIVLVNLVTNPETYYSLLVGIGLKSVPFQILGTISSAIVSPFIFVALVSCYRLLSTEEE